MKNRLLNTSRLTPLMYEGTQHTSTTRSMDDTVTLDTLCEVINTLDLTGKVPHRVVMSESCYDKMKGEADKASDQDIEYTEIAGIRIIVDKNLPGDVYQFRRKDGGILATNLMQ